MRVLVTGAEGFVGKPLCTSLQRVGHHVIPASVRTRSAFEALQVGAKSTPDTVIHLAARVHVMKDRVADRLAAFRAANVDSTLQLAAEAAAAGVGRFVFISSVKVNGESTAPGYSFSESDMAAPADAYAVSKWEAEQGLHQIAISSGMEVVIVRPPLVYGAGVKANFASLMRAVQRGMPFPLGSVHNLRSLIGLDNLVDFIITCVSSPPAANHTFLVSDGADISTLDLILAMGRAARCPARVFPVPLGILSMFALLPGQRSVVDRLCSNLQVDISKAREILGWVPPFTLDEGLRRAFEGCGP